MTEAAILRTRPPSTRKPSVCTAMWRSTARSSSWTSRLAASSTLTQELNRESNTIGSKCQDVAITRLVVELKSEIEKIREQIQNIE